MTITCELDLGELVALCEEYDAMLEAEEAWDAEIAETEAAINAAFARDAARDGFW